MPHRAFCGADSWPAGAERLLATGWSPGGGGCRLPWTRLPLPLRGSAPSAGRRTRSRRDRRRWPGRRRPGREGREGDDSEWASSAGSESQDVRYEPDERPPLPLTIGLGLQYAMLTVASVVLSPVILISTVGGSEAYLGWVVFAALVVSGVTTVIQVVRVGRIGSGYLLLMGSSSAYLAICVTALERGGGGLLGTLIIISSLFQFVLAAKLSLFRRIFTPTVAGTVLMLIPVMLSPTIVGKMTDVPAHASPAAAPVTAAVTLGVIIAISVRATGAWRIWAAAAGMLAGSLVGGLAFGIYDTERILEASWIGGPTLAWPGLDLSLGPRLLEPAAGVRAADVRRRHGHHRRLHRHPAHLLAPAARHRLPVHPGRARRRRAGQPPVRPDGHAAQHDVRAQHRGRRSHPGHRAGRRHLRRHHLRHPRLPAEARGRRRRHPRPRGRRLLHRAGVVPLRPGAPGAPARRPRLPEGRRRGPRLLARARPSSSTGSSRSTSRACGAICSRTA